MIKNEDQNFISGYIYIYIEKVSLNGILCDAAG